MSKTGKIATSTFTKPYDSPNGRVYYHDIMFEGDATKYNIGSKDQSPDFLAVGQTLTYEIPNPAKPNSIKRVKEAPANFSGSGGGYKPDTVGITVGNAISNAALLVAHGVVKADNLEAAARNIATIAFKLKEEFAGR